MNQKLLLPRLVSGRFDEPTLLLDILKDRFPLSIDNGDLVSTEVSWQRFTANLAYNSVGGQSASLAECAKHELRVIKDDQPHPKYCSIVFTTFDKNRIKKKATLLSAPLHREEVA